MTWQELATILGPLAGLAAAGSAAWLGLRAKKVEAVLTRQQQQDATADSLRDDLLAELKRRDARLEKLESDNATLWTRVDACEKENRELKKVVQKLQNGVNGAGPGGTHAV